MTIPFYLKGTGENLISSLAIDNFAQRNTELSNYIYSYKIELRTIDIPYFESFVNWILYQQISGYLAEKQLLNCLELMGEITPSNVLLVKSSQFSKIGIPKFKIKYIKNLASFFLSEPNLSQINRMNSKEILNYFTSVKGIGEWSVNMFLIFSLGKLNVLAAGDLVVRKGVKKMYDLSFLPSKSFTTKICKNWSGLNTIGSLLAWAVVEN